MINPEPLQTPKVGSSVSALRAAMSALLPSSTRTPFSSASPLLPGAFVGYPLFKVVADAPLFNCSCGVAG